MSRILRPAVAAALGLTVVLAGVSQAAPAKKGKAVCNLVTDDKGDTFAYRSQELAGVFGPQEDGLDIVSADIANDAKTITAVVRVAKLAPSVSSAPGGIAFRMQFLLPGVADDTNLYISATKSGATETFVFGTRAITANLSTPIGDAKGVFDMAKSEVRIHLPITAFDKVASPVKPGALFDFGDLDQTSSRSVAAGRSLFADVTVGGSPYKAGTKSCVVPGK